MKEQRQKAYLNLLKDLLDCPSGQEQKILEANQELVDAGFLNTVEAVAQMCLQNGDNKTANRLQGLAIQLEGELNRKTEVNLQSLDPREVQTYFQLLMELMEATAEGGGDRSVVYQLMKKNTDRLNNVFLEVLRQLGTSILEQEKSIKEAYAGVISVFGVFIAQFPFGNKASNLEIAIATCEISQTILTQSSSPYIWAESQMNLGNNYISRIEEKKEENVEKAIAAYNEALKVFTKSTYSYEWAGVQHGLGNAYSEKNQEDKAESIEKAITCFQDALKVTTIELFAQEWAETTDNMGIAYLFRIFGDKAANIEKAITCFQDALKIRTFNAYPIQWADTQNNFGFAYRERIKGKKEENIEKAIAAFNEALKVFTKSAIPRKWATTHKNLGVVYSERIKGKKEENIEKAIAAFNEALKVFTKSAIPSEWAVTQMNLGTAYGVRAKGEKEENIEKAIAAFNEALKVFTKSSFPSEWAGVQHDLGTAYNDRIRGNKIENTKKAITAFAAALEVRTPSAFPQNHAESLWSMGFAYRFMNRSLLAYNAFDSAIATVESLREEIVSGEESKKKQAEAWMGLYGQMIEVCLEIDNITAAIEYVERSKTRSLVEQILERDFQTIFPSNIVTKLEKYRDEIASGQYQIQNGTAKNSKITTEHLHKLRQQRNELQNRYLPVGYGFQFESFQATLDNSTAIIEWYILNTQILAFIITQKEGIKVWQSQTEEKEALENWVDLYLQNYDEQKDNWKNSLIEELKKLSFILHIDELIIQIPRECKKLILIPHRFLHLLPIHALPVNQNSEYSSCLIDFFAGGVSYAPSCQILQQVQKRDRPDFQSLFAIQNPTKDLNYTDLEVQVIKSYFNADSSKVLEKTAATLAEVNNTDLNSYHCTHFSCHGYFNLTTPGKSALILADAPAADTLTKPDSERYLNVRLGETHDLNKCLTLENIFTLQLEKCRLVTLSACETGLIDYQNTSDEYIGLPSGFLLAGSPSVVSSLWKVDDLSTSFLMIKFYENLFKLDRLEAGDVAIALKKAQTWLRNLSIQELNKFLEEHKHQIEQVLVQLRKGQRLRFEESLKLIKKRQPLPFANPYYWAGFTASGL